MIDEVLTCAELLSQNELPALKSRMGEEAYFINFMRLTETIAPDGERIKTVGFTALRGGTERRVSLQIPKGKIDTFSSEVSSDEPLPEAVEIEGQLRLASSLTANNLIKVKTGRRDTETVVVPEGLMDDIVRPLWNRKVRVIGTRQGGIISLRDIKAVDD